MTAVVFTATVMLATVMAAAQQITGVPGSPSATTTIQGDQLPAPPPKFGGKIERNAAQSKPYWPPRIEPRKGAPNVLLIMTDDSGFGVPSTFGGVIPTPALDRIAANGLRYTNFHSTALCSPTRAAIITGRNHHSVGFGVVAEQATGFPGYDSVITRDKATIGRILKDNGYRTSWFGKDHNVPAFQASQDGPFDQWPIGMGFEYFYGFIGGDANQWQPNLFRNTTAIYPYVNNPGWNLITAQADDAIAYMKRINALAPDQPFFVYYVPGGTGVLKVDGKVVAKQKMEHTIPLILQWDENFDVGSDTGTPVDNQDYQVPFKFTGKLTKLTLNIDRPKLTPEDEKKLMEAQRNNKVSE